MITTPELPENFDIAELRSEILILKNMVMELKEELTQVKKERDELKEEVKRLKSQLNLNSQNSSKGWGAGVYASANLSTDGNLLQHARAVARDVLNDDPLLEHPRNALLSQRLDELANSRSNFGRIS